MTDSTEYSITSPVELKNRKSGGGLFTSDLKKNNTFQEHTAHFDKYDSNKNTSFTVTKDPKSKCSVYITCEQAKQIKDKLNSRVELSKNTEAKLLQITEQINNLLDATKIVDELKSTDNSVKAPVELIVKDFVKEFYTGGVTFKTVKDTKDIDNIKKNISKSVKAKILGEPIIVDIGCKVYLDGYMDKEKKNYIPQDGTIFKILPATGAFYVRYNISSTSIVNKDKGTVREDQITLDQLCITKDCELSGGRIHKGGFVDDKGTDGVDFMRICE
jgi:hypothetical protein